MPVTQDERLISITTPLGKDVLLLEGFQGTEAISALFRLTLFMLSENPSLSFGAIVGKTATIKIKTESGERYINGFVSQFSQGFADRGFFRYHAVLAPWLWNLTRTADCRIFQDKTVPDIIKQIFQDLGFSDFRMMLTGNYQPRTYCVQYRETDFNFVSRLMEEEGIFYFFEHSADKHVMVLGDSADAHKPCPEQTSYPYQLAGGPRGSHSVTSWLQEQEVRPAQYTLTDYNFETPSNDLKANTPTKVTVGRNSKLEIYDYPGEYLKRPEGERYVKLHMEEEEVLHTRIHGSSDAPALTPGYFFDLTHHYRGDFEGAYLLTSVTHQAASNLLGEGGASYSNSFTCIPKDVPFRPARVTSRPFVRGPQTAVVVGKKGEEIWTDKYGRVKVQFHWDREGKKDENSSCWIRVGTLWAGKQWGVIHIPRIGQEVIVDFLEGDPDQPIIVGSVYNAEQMPPYGLPGNQTQSGIKSRSSKEGGASNFNEFRFEDKKGAEEIYLHGEKDWKIKIEHDKTQEVDHDETLTVQNNRTTTVMMDHSETVGKNQTITIAANQSTTVGASQSTTVAASITINAGASITITAGGTVTITAPMIMLNAAMVQVSGVVQCATLITNSVVSPLYTPGVGNLI